MIKTFNVLYDFTRVTEHILTELGYEILHEELSECGLYMNYTVQLIEE